MYKQKMSKFIQYFLFYTFLVKQTLIQSGIDNANQLNLNGQKAIDDLEKIKQEYTQKSYDYENEIERFITGLDKKMNTDKPYLNADLTIDSLAESIDCTRHHLSQVINEQLGKSFYDYINQYRVEEAKQLLADPSRDNHKIASIAFDAGFNSISTFNDVFKKLAGSTPSQFRKQREEKLQRQRV